MDQKVLMFNRNIKEIQGKNTLFMIPEVPNHDTIKLARINATPSKNHAAGMWANTIKASF
jgi:hypothetical protein